MSGATRPEQAAALSRIGERNVLHVRTVVGAGGGADKTTLKSPSYLEAAGYRAWAAYLHTPRDPGFSEIRRRAEAWSCPLIEIVDRGPLDPSVVFRLAGICRRLEVKIWHAHEYKSNLVGLFLKPFLRLHLVSTVHGWVEFSPRLSLFYKLDRWALRRYDRVIAVSQDVFDLCLAAGVRPERLCLIRNAIEVEAYARRHEPAQSPGRAAAAQEELIRKVPPGRQVIGAVGRLSAEKGFDVLIEAFAKLCRRGFDLELWIAGEGEERRTLEQRAARCGYGERIAFLGFCPDARRLFECFDVFCLPSLREGLPNVVLEAMALEVPIVATKLDGLGGVLEDEEQALLVTPGSASALESALSRVLESGALRRRLAGAARTRVAREFNFAERMGKVVALYESLLGQSAAPSQTAR